MLHAHRRRSPDAISRGSLEAYWTAPDAIRSELIWLEALSRESDLTVPEPVRNRRGELVTFAGGAACTLLTWVDGEQRERIATPEEAEAVGAMIGRLPGIRRAGRPRRGSRVPRTTIPASWRR